jgi:hypothetical protein
MVKASATVKIHSEPLQKKCNYCINKKIDEEQSKRHVYCREWQIDKLWYIERGQEGADSHS